MHKFIVQIYAKSRKKGRNRNYLENLKRKLIKQRERVRKGWFPMNPKRKEDYDK